MRFEISENLAKQRPAIWAFFFNLIKEKAGFHCHIKWVGAKQRASVVEHHGPDGVWYEETMDRMLIFEAQPT